MLKSLREYTKRMEWPTPYPGGRTRPDTKSQCFKPSRQMLLHWEQHTHYLGLVKVSVADIMRAFNKHVVLFDAANSFNEDIERQCTLLTARLKKWEALGAKLTPEEIARAAMVNTDFIVAGLDHDINLLVKTCVAERLRRVGCSTAYRRLREWPQSMGTAPMGPIDPSFSVEAVAKITAASMEIWRAHQREWLIYDVIDICDELQRCKRIAPDRLEEASGLASHELEDMFLLGNIGRDRRASCLKAYMHLRDTGADHVAAIEYLRDIVSDALICVDLSGQVFTISDWYTYSSTFESLSMLLCKQHSQLVPDSFDLVYNDELEVDFTSLLLADDRTLYIHYRDD